MVVIAVSKDLVWFLLVSVGVLWLKPWCIAIVVTIRSTILAWRWWIVNLCTLSLLVGWCCISLFSLSGISTPGVNHIWLVTLVRAALIWNRRLVTFVLDVTWLTLVLWFLDLHITFGRLDVRFLLLLLFLWDLATLTMIRISWTRSLLFVLINFWFYKLSLVACWFRTNLVVLRTVPFLITIFLSFKLSQASQSKVFVAYLILAPNF